MGPTSKGRGREEGWEGRGKEKGKGGRGKGKGGESVPLLWFYNLTTAFNRKYDLGEVHFTASAPERRKALLRHWIRFVRPVCLIVACTGFELGTCALPTQCAYLQRLLRWCILTWLVSLCENDTLTSLSENVAVDYTYNWGIFPPNFQVSMSFEWLMDNAGRTDGWTDGQTALYHNGREGRIVSLRRQKYRPNSGLRHC